jgi:hypothetical protein
MYEGIMNLRAAAAGMIAGLISIAPAQARTSLGIFGRWGAFVDDRPSRCFAIAQPVAKPGGSWRPFATIANWPRQTVRNQMHFRLRYPHSGDTPVTLQIGDRRFALSAGTADAWAQDTRADLAIIAAIRSSTLMGVTARTPAGRNYTDVYTLRGAATAIDAAALACAR